MSQTSANRSEAFGRLLSGAINSIATYEGRTAPAVEDELGQLLHLSGKTIQRYKAGNLPPEAHAVEVLAEAAVRRGYLGREWLGRFLHAARYPAADTLLNRLCPAAPARPRLPRVYHNLPAPTYSQFVMREQAFAEVLDGLGQRSAAVLVVGLGGNGKTSLAREVAARCLQEDAGAVRFDAVVWVSDKDRPGTTNLSVVLDEIARTLDYPGFTQFSHDEKRYEVEQLLRRQRILLVVDNFETITDGALLTWLLRLPEPSKALITSREYRRAFRNSTIVLDLRGMREEEAQTLVNQRLRMLRMEQLVSEQAQLEPLLAVTGGNPKAIEIALGLVKHERRPLQHVVDDLHAARGELFDDLFTRAWALLDEAAHRVLMVMTFFPTSANGEALAATADVHGYVFERAIERLTDLALLDVQQEKLNEAPRYALHSLVHAFAKAKLVGQPEVEEEARERWVEWCMQLVTRVGYCWNELERLDILTPEQETIFLAIQRMFNTNHFEQVMLLIKEANYYYYIRGFWTEKLAMNILYMQASQTLGRIPEMIKALADTVHLLSRQGNQEAASHYATELRTLAQHHDLPPSLHFDILHAFAHFAQLEGDLEAAQQAWYEGMEIARHLDPILFNNSQHRVAVSLLHQEKYQEAYAMFESALWESRSANYLRATAYHLSRMAEICIHWHQADQAALQLAESLNLISACQDRPLLARIQYIYARLHALRGDFPAACASLAEAIDLFERMGMRRELAEARAELAKLSAQGAPA